ncbi:reverse transcriptase [Tanacetum coccineum]|uniref:Reverse transcriptase n=1 Tax=Tanacetum coccineum TaxID=301880 RepID=A0ABQ5HP72_9ASTR
MLNVIRDRLNGGEGTGQRGNNGGQNGNNGGNNGGAYGRLTKIEFPKFEGDDVLSWLYRVNKFFEMDHLDDDAQKIRLVSMHMFGKALNWHKHFMAKHGAIMTWDLYQTHIKKRFESVFEDPIVALKNLKQTTTVQYTPGHKCSGQLYSLEVIGEGLDDVEDGDMQLTEEGIMSTYTTSLLDEPPLISLNALTGENSYRTMRVKAYVRKNVVHTLVDCGSTHNFLDWNTARKLGCKLRNICPLEVSMANGTVMSSKYECKDFSWEFQRVTYTTNVMNLPLRGCEMVLGIQWLSTLGWIRCDFKNLVMEYTYNNKKVVLRGTKQATIQWMQGKQRQGKKLVSAELFAMSVCVCPTTFMQMKAGSSHSKDVEAVYY